MSAGSVNDAFARHFARQGIKHPLPIDEGRRLTTNAFGESVEAPDMADIAVGWLTWHRTDRWVDADGDVDAAGASLGRAKGGMVVDVSTNPETGERRVTVFEPRKVPGERIMVEEYLWPVHDLEPERTYPASSTECWSYAMRFLDAALWNRKSWTRHHDKMVIAYWVVTAKPRGLADEYAMAQGGRVPA